MKTPKCLNSYLIKTQKGNRNHNFFRAMAHLRKYNKNTGKTEFITKAEELNKNLFDPLPKHEIKNIIKNVFTHDYKSNCLNFKEHCEKCRLGHNKIKFNQYMKGYWKTIDQNNLIHVDLVSGLQVYLWDILDTALLTPEQKQMVYDLRISKGLNPIIDNILKYRGVSIGDKALEEWNIYREKEVI